MFASIVKRNLDIIIDKQNVNKFKRLGIIDLLDHNDYNSYISKVLNNPTINKIVQELLSGIFDITTPHIIDSLLMVYAFPKYKDEIFVPYQTTMDNKLVVYASRTIVMLNTILTTGEIDDKFFSTYDKYYSMYMMWRIKLKIRDIDNIYAEIYEEIETHNVMKLMGISQNINIEESICSSLKRMVDINKLVSINIILRDYIKFSGHKGFYDLLWRLIEQESKSNFFDVTVSLITQLKKNILQHTTDIDLKRKLYYDIDTELIVNSVILVPG